MRAARLAFATLLTSVGPAWAACPVIGTLPAAPNPFELQFGTTNTNAALGSGGLTATLSRCGEITSLKWPGPSYWNQLDYLTDNAVGARLEAHFGALDDAGAFAGITYRTPAGSGFTWLRDDPWTHAQQYTRDDSDVAVTTMTNAALGLTVTAWTFVLPGADVLVSRYRVDRAPGSPVRKAALVFYANLAPTMNRLPDFPVADWGLDFQNDYAVVYDHREHALLAFVPQSAAAYPHDFSVLNPLLQHPPASRTALAHAVDRLIGRLTEPGVYLAVGAAPRDNGFQAGFDDAPMCAHQSAVADRAISAFQLPPAFDAAARGAFECDRVIADPAGPLGACRAANGWTYAAANAFADAARGGALSRSPIAACQANAALARRLRFRGGSAEATFYLAAAATRDAAYALLRQARAGTPDAQRAATEQWWASFLAPAHLPDTADPEVLAFAKRSLIVMRTATDSASGAIVASVDTQPPYGEDWPRDGSFINYALDLAGYTDLVSRHNRFYARVQRKTPQPWSILYAFGPCDPGAPTYPSCVPAGTFETNYYADPAAVVPGDPISFEIDEAGLGVWTMWSHARYLTDPAAAAQYLADVCPSIALGATNLAACRDATTGLQCPANEDDDIPLTEGLQGAETVLLALESAVAAAPACGFDAATVTGWQARAAELRQAIQAAFFVGGALPHYEGGRPAWLLWPVDFFAPGDAVALTHAQWLEQQTIDPILTRTAPSGAYNAEALLARAQLFRRLGDTAGLAASQDAVRFFVHNLTTAGTRHLGEAYGLVDVDLNGDGVVPDYWPENDVPHVWEHAYLYAAAMVAFGSR
ncbi:MAG TPA: hypothetical protein VKW76_04220 [Candidatus Binatia bacterium]|nr:hypothetical protein [Candidatus Binatia bacterium]